MAKEVELLKQVKMQVIKICMMEDGIRLSILWEETNAQFGRYPWENLEEHTLLFFQKNW